VDGRLDEAPQRRLVGRLADLHRHARRGAEVSRWADATALATLVTRNLRQTRADAHDALGTRGWELLEHLLRTELHRRQALVTERAQRGVPCEGHGDLRLDHCYLLPDRPAPDDLVVVDCIEFSEALRCLDPVLDVAFLVMDLEIRGRADLGRAFFDAWAVAAGDDEGRALLPLFVAHRHVVRAKVDGLKAREPEVPGVERTVAASHAARHLLSAIGRLATDAQRPALVLIGGLPGAGKSSLARGLADLARFEVVGSDTVRKELAGLSPSVSARADLDAGLYTPEWTDRTYEECAARARDVLRDGGRVIVDASFGIERRRRQLLEVAADLGVPAAFLACQASDAEAERRLTTRRLDPSDADVEVRRHLAASWQEPSEATAACTVPLDTEGPTVDAVQRACAALAHRGLAQPPVAAPHRAAGPATGSARPAAAR
jgi:predicted kinase